LNEALVDALVNIVGAESAFVADDARAAAYHDLFGFIADRKADYIAAVLPEDVDSLRAIVRLASESNLGIWSMPNAAGNGARIGAAGKPGLIVDLQRMNRILQVDEASATALIEPGVSYRQLHDYLTSNGIPLRVDPDRNADHSIAGSICSRHNGFTPYGDHLLMQCGMEVVLPDGDLLRTGMGALPGNNTWQLFKYNFGPYIDGLFTQSDFALLTKIGLWLMQEPPRYLPFTILLPDQQAASAAIELLRPMKIGALIPNTITIMNTSLDRAFYGKTDDDGYGWKLYAALYGAPDNVDLSWETVAGALSSIDGSRLYQAGERDVDPGWRDWQRLMEGKPSEAKFDHGNINGGAAMRLTAAAPMEGEIATRMHGITAKVLAEHNLEHLCEYLLTQRTMLMQIYLPYDRADRADFDNAVAAARLVLQNLTAAGYGIVDESLELRHVVDNIYTGSGLNDLVARIHQGLTAATV
jgi:4-cresol dehydrogenase (hydroxylating)